MIIQVERVGLVHSHQMHPDGTLNNESKKRVREGISLLENESVSYLVMCGGPGYMTNKTMMPRGTRPVHSEVMCEYALAHGVPEELLSIQDYSSDTVGEAYFAKEGILVRENWKEPQLRENPWSNIIVVSSDYHIDRCAAIWDHILGDDFSIEFLGVPTPDSQKKRKLIENEKRGTAMFWSQFGGIPKGDSPALEKRLYEVHGLYSKIPEPDRLLFYPQTSRAELPIAAK